MSNKTSDKNVVSKDDIKALKKDLFYYDELKEQYDDDTVKFYEALRHILTEREQDKKKIQELEAIDEANRKVIVEKCDYIQNDSIPKQKVKDKIERLRSKAIKYENDNKVILNNINEKYLNEKNLEKFDSTDLIIYSLNNAYLEKISILKELLEDK